MKLIIQSIIIILVFSCSQTGNINSLVGTWHYSKKLFLEEQKKLKDPKFDLSYKYKTIKMIFSDSEFISYLDNQVTQGKWKIENDSLHMFLETHGWNKYIYKHINQ